MPEQRHPQNPETLEAAREMLLQNSETMQQMQEQIDALTAEKAEKDTEIENLRTLNQRLFLRAAQGEEDPEPEPEKVQSLADFAKSQKGVFF